MGFLKLTHDIRKKLTKTKLRNCILNFYTEQNLHCKNIFVPPAYSVMLLRRKFRKYLTNATAMKAFPLIHATKWNTSKNKHATKPCNHEHYPAKCKVLFASGERFHSIVRRKARRPEISERMNQNTATYSIYST